MTFFLVHLTQFVAELLGDVMCNLKSAVRVSALCGWLGLLIQSISAADAIVVPEGTAARSFSVFDGLLFREKPDLRSQGVQGISIVYAGSFWKRDESNDEAPSDEKIAKIASDLKDNSTPIVIDIEHWSLQGDQDLVAQNIKKYRSVANRLKAHLPDRRIGYYSLLPLRDYHRALKGSNTLPYRAWQEENDQLVSLAKDVDILFPSLYTFYRDEDGWERYAKEQIREARRVANGKRVIAFLWPRYHSGNSPFGGGPIPATFWRRQLELVFKLADGVVLWGGWQQSWDENASWWQETKSFMRDKGLAKSR